MFLVSHNFWQAASGPQLPPKVTNSSEQSSARNGKCSTCLWTVGLPIRLQHFHIGPSYIQRKQTEIVATCSLAGLM